MGPLLLFLLTLYQLHASIGGEFVEPSSSLNLNSITNNDDDDMNSLIPPEVDNNESNEAAAPFVKNDNDHTEMIFRQPITALSIDYSKNVIVLKFREGRLKMLTPREEVEKFRGNDFIRLGRSGPTAGFMRFGKRESEELPADDNENRSNFKRIPGESLENSRGGLRDSRGDNFMRFGKASKDLMRFGRAPGDFMRFGRSASADFMRFGRGGPNDFMRFGRSPKQDFMRFGRNPKQDFMRFGRNPKQDFMRFGRPDNFMRFGKAASLPSGNTGGEQMENFMRFGKMDHHSINQLDVGASNKPNNSQAVKVQQQQQQQQQLAEAPDAGNPMDNAIKVLFQKQQQQDQLEKHKQLQQNANINDSDRTTTDFDLGSDYGLGIAEH